MSKNGIATARFQYSLAVSAGAVPLHVATLQPIQPTLKDAKLSCTNTRQWVCGLKMNKLIGRASHRLSTFSTSIREIREIKYYFNIWGIRKKKKEGGSEGGGENSPISPPLDPRLPCTPKVETFRTWHALPTFWARAWCGRVQFFKMA